ncbi:MAG TPA: hypothetical protein PLV42_04835 [bacterium]|nr:hypothetical protein [bacterium]
MLDITDIGRAAGTLYWVFLAGAAIGGAFGVLALRVKSPAIRWALIADMAIVAFLLIAFSALFIHHAVLKGYAYSGDEASTLYQGQIFAQGDLWKEPLPAELQRSFPRHHVVVQEDREYSKYPPLTALAIAAALAFNHAEWANIAVTMAAFLLLLWCARLLSGGWRVPLLTAIPFLFATTVIFHAASYFSHPLSMCLILATVIALILNERSRDNGGRRRYAFIIGLLVGLLLLARPYDALLTAAAIVCYHLWDLAAGPDRRALLRRWAARWGEWLALIGGGAIGAFLFLGYQKLYTGSFFLSPYRIYDAGGEVMAELTLTADQLFGRGLSEITVHWLGQQAAWSSAAVMVLAVIYFSVRSRKMRRSERIVLLLPLLFIVGYAFHPFFGGDSFGARYYYPVIWCWFYAAAALIQYLARRFTQGHGAFLYLLFAVAVTVPFHQQLIDRCNGVSAVVAERFSLNRAIEERIPTHERAVVLLGRTPQYDGPFYVRHDPLLRDRIVYGCYRTGFPLTDDFQRAFPGRSYYKADFDRSAGVFRILPLRSPIHQKRTTPPIGGILP